MLNIPYLDWIRLYPVQVTTVNAHVMHTSRYHAELMTPAYIQIVK